MDCAPGYVILVAGYELGPARWIHQKLGLRHHLVAEVLLFGTLGPALAFGMLQLQLPNHLLKRQG